MNFELTVTLVGFFASISSIVFAYLAFRRSDKQEQKTDGKTEGVMFSAQTYTHTLTHPSSHTSISNCIN